MATEVDIKNVLQGLELLKAKGSDLRPVFRDVREWLKVDVQHHFEANEGPDGAWAPRAASSVARKLQTRRYRRKRGKLKGSFTRRGANWFRRQLGRFRKVNAYKFVVTRQSLEMRARGDWAGIHQFGGIAGKGARIPARPFLWVSETLVDRFKQVLVGYLLRSW